MIWYEWLNLKETPKKYGFWDHMFDVYKFLCMRDLGMENYMTDHFWRVHSKRFCEGIRLPLRLVWRALVPYPSLDLMVHSIQHNQVLKRLPTVIGIPLGSMGEIKLPSHSICARLALRAKLTFCKKKAAKGRWVPGGGSSKELIALQGWNQEYLLCALDQVGTRQLKDECGCDRERAREREQECVCVLVQAWVCAWYHEHHRSS